MAIAYLGLGTNLGERRRNLRDALRQLAEVVSIQAVSSVYESEPVGFREQPDFWNLVVRVETELDPFELLERVSEVERRLGRTRPFPGAPRTIDVDILLYDDAVIRTPELQIPHPRMLERAFVLRPLAELDPGVEHPIAGRTVGEILAGATGLERAERLFGGAELLRDDDA